MIPAGTWRYHSLPLLSKRRRLGMANPRRARRGEGDLTSLPAADEVGFSQRLKWTDDSYRLPPLCNVAGRRALMDEGDARPGQGACRTWCHVRRRAQL